MKKCPKCQGIMVRATVLLAETGSILEAWVCFICNIGTPVSPPVKKEADKKIIIPGRG